MIEIVEGVADGEILTISDTGPVSRWTGQGNQRPAPSVMGNPRLMNRMMGGSGRPPGGGGGGGGGRPGGGGPR